jgi:hypothetical protein
MQVEKIRKKKQAFFLANFFRGLSSYGADCSRSESDPMGTESTWSEILSNSKNFKNMLEGQLCSIDVESHSE